MRMMFTSARVENVERVKAFFDEAGIENKITGGRSYKTYSRRDFTYNARQQSTNEQQPQLWVIRADDYRQAREILLEQGLLEIQKAHSYLPESLNKIEKKQSPANKSLKIKLLLLAIVGGMSGLLLLQMMTR
jgi:hypothetical protein